MEAFESWIQESPLEGYLVDGTKFPELLMEANADAETRLWRKVRWFSLLEATLVDFT